MMKVGHLREVGLQRGNGETLGRRVEKRRGGRWTRSTARIAAGLGAHLKTGSELVAVGELLRRVGPHLKRQSRHDRTDEEQRGQRAYRKDLFAIEPDHGPSSAIL